MRLRLPAVRRLRWKLMFSYVFFTPLIMLLLSFIIFLATLVIIELFFVPPLVLYGLQQYPTQLEPFFVHQGVPDQQALTFWIKHPGGYSSGYQPVFRAIVDSQGRVVTSIGSVTLPAGSFLQTRLPAQAAANLRQVLASGESNQGMVSKGADGAIIAIVPIRGENQRVEGALIDNTGPTVYGQEALYWFWYDLIYIISSVAAYTFFALIIGMVSSLFIARTITRRFTALAMVADNWSRGDFSTFAQDKSPDELGQLARALNRMAEQLQNLLQTRQKLAILEERNRLARDLHDSVKQHLFVISLQVGTACVHLEGEPDITEARQRLAEAEHMLQEVQGELKTLIRELRPVALEGKGLVSALRELIEQWQSQTHIPVTLSSEGTDVIPLLTEEAFFRVAQEALANVARHSQASAVQVQLINEAEQITLVVCDNGKGFDSADVAGKGVGLLSMQERMQAMRGNVEIESQPGQGTRLRARCRKPLDEV